MNKPIYSRILVVFFLLCVTACHRVPDEIEPKINHTVQDRYLQALPSPFPPLTAAEKSQDFGKEYLIGLSFARDLDLYQAITAFRRAEILIPPEEKARKLEIQYEILLCYYVGRKYSDVIYTFDHSRLKYLDSNFPALHDLLLILYDSYLQEGNQEQADRTFLLIEQYSPESAEQLGLSAALTRGDLSEVKHYASEMPNTQYIDEFVSSYESQKKSVLKAQMLNVVLPGTGYLYLGQKQSALTAFLLNGLFIAASVHFFQHKQVAAGIIFASFETGWYFGGIYGAGLEAKFYNERLYEKLATPMMNQRGLFPVLMLNYAF